MYEIKASRYKTQMTLTIKQFSAQDIGTYNCISTNSIGKTEGTITLYGELKSSVGFERKVFKIVSSSKKIKGGERYGYNDSLQGFTQVTQDTSSELVVIEDANQPTTVAMVEETKESDQSQVTQVATVSTSIEKIPLTAAKTNKGGRLGIKLQKSKEAKDLTPKDFKILNLEARVKELEGEKKLWMEKEKAFAQKLESAKKFTSEAMQVNIDIDYLGRRMIF